MIPVCSVECCDLLESRYSRVVFCVGALLLVIVYGDIVDFTPICSSYFVVLPSDNFEDEIPFYLGIL